jgi:hypothetical protein
VANAMRPGSVNPRLREQEQTNRAYVPVYWIGSGLLRSASRRMSIEYTLVSVCAGRRRRLAGRHTVRTKPFARASKRVAVARGTAAFVWVVWHYCWTGSDCALYMRKCRAFGWQRVVKTRGEAAWFYGCRRPAVRTCEPGRPQSWRGCMPQPSGGLACSRQHYQYMRCRASKVMVW